MRRELFTSVLTLALGMILFTNCRAKQQDLSNSLVQESDPTSSSSSLTKGSLFQCSGQRPSVVHADVMVKSLSPQRMVMKVTPMGPYTGYFKWEGDVSVELRTPEDEAPNATIRSLEGNTVELVIHSEDIADPVRRQFGAILTQRRASWMGFGPLEESLPEEMLCLDLQRFIPK